MDYAAPAWQPWLSNINIACMESFQIRALPIVTGQLVSKTIEDLQMKGNVPSYTTTSNSNVLKAKEKSLRSSADHPKRISFNVEVPQQLPMRSSWKLKANKLSETLPDALNHCEQMEIFKHPSMASKCPRQLQHLLLCSSNNKLC